MKAILGFLRKIALFPLNVFMGATTDLTGGSLAQRPAHAENKKFVVKSNVITIPAGGATNDILKAIPVKAGWMVTAVHAKVITPGVGTAVAADVGITGDQAAGFLSNKDLTQSAGTTILGGQYNGTYGYVASANTTIDVKLHTITAMTTPAAIQLYAEMIDLN